MATSSSTTQSEKRLTATANWFSSGTRPLVDIVDSAVEGAVLRLRPITMTRLVAMPGLLRAAVSHGIGSDSQRPFAIVIVRGFGSLAASQKS
jgi:Cu/Ag efflux pump CusA